jgi:hypothetical protein
MDIYIYIHGQDEHTYTRIHTHSDTNTHIQIHTKSYVKRNTAELAPLTIQKFSHPKHELSSRTLPLYMLTHTHTHTHMHTHLYVYVHTSTYTYIHM